MKIRKKASNPARHYINNRKLLETLVAYRKELEEAKKTLPENKWPRPPNYIGESILMLCEKLSLRPNFFRYTWRDDMIGDGIADCVAAVTGFDENKTNNPFGYFTQIAFNAFVRKIQREQKQSYVKYKNYDDLFQLANDAARSEEGAMQKGSNENVDAFIANFERKMSKPRGRGKKKVAKTFG